MKIASTLILFSLLIGAFGGDIFGQNQKDTLTPKEKSRVVTLYQAARDSNQKIFNNRHSAFISSLSTKSKSFESLTTKEKQKVLKKEPNPTKILGKLKDEAGYDTVAFRQDRRGNLHVAANVKTRTNFVSSKAGFKTGDYELKPSDTFRVTDVLRRTESLRNKPVTFVTLANKPTTNEGNAGPHAEMKLMKDRMQNPSPRGRAPLMDKNNNQITPKETKRLSAIAASKPACEGCAGPLAKAKIAHNDLGGLPKSKITNWQDPNKIGDLRRLTIPPPGSRRGSILVTNNIGQPKPSVIGRPRAHTQPGPQPILSKLGISSSSTQSNSRRNSIIGGSSSFIHSRTPSGSPSMSTSRRNSISRTTGALAKPSWSRRNSVNRGLPSSSASMSNSRKNSLTGSTSIGGGKPIGSGSKSRSTSRRA